MKKIIIAAFAGAVVLSLGAYLYWTIPENNPTPRLEDHALKQLVEDYSAKKVSSDSASITSHQLKIKETDGDSLTYALPKNEFFVSIAPYINETHPCAIHSLTGCQGEMVEEDFNVTVADKDGNTVLSETVTSFPNGFIDLWLPRDNTYQVTIENSGKKAETTITTFEGDDTCISTMQLS